MKRFGLNIFFIVLLTSCHSFHTESDISSANTPTISARIAFIDFDGEVKKERTDYKPEQPLLVFSFILGNFLGDLNTSILIKRRIGTYRFPPYVREDLKFARELAAPLQKSLTHFEVSIPEVKIARLATFAVGSDTEEEIGRAGWLDPKSQDLLMLVYFNQKCRIKGVMKGGGGENHFDLAIPNEGFHWIRRTYISDTAVHPNYTEPPEEVVFFIDPYDDI